ncbi:hypothetical protein GCM10009765_19050 [Fodinicola feengrottensis]|uniref:Glycosyltransferase RgtA/B/C/D-like domain-containing protein n=2 Tax=Fodinicola feengrottensis TaxID=435914 RepID=A0ABN2GE44_9ACTN
MTLATLPAIAGALFFFLLKRPGADLSGLVLRAGVLTSVTAVVVLELLSIPSAATRLALVLVWVVVVLALAAVLVLRWRRGGSEIPADAHPRQWWSVVRARAGQVYAYEWVAVVAMAAFALVELILGQVWLPNTQDSMTYHLARLEHWRLNDSIYPYASIIYRQVTYAPGGEYLSFTLRVLGDTIWATPLMQWASALACGIVAYRIARQLGCGRAGRMLAAVLTLTAPALVVQASGTSNDLIAGFFLLGFASLVLEFRDGKGSWWLAAITGITLGMAVLTKSTTIPLAAGFGLWWVWILVRQRLDGVKWAALAAVIVIAISGPYLVVETILWGSPSGPPATNSILIGAHDPITIAMNGTKIMSSELVSADPVETKAVCAATSAIHQLAHRSIYDPNTEFGTNKFLCRYDNDEKYEPNPWQTYLVIGAILALIAVGLAVQRAYAISLVISSVAFVSYISYQPWIARLFLGAILAGCPLIPVAINRLTQKWPSATSLKSAIGGGLAVTVTLSGMTALVASPRALGPAVFKQRPLDTQALPRNPDVAAAVAMIRAAGAQRIGLAGFEETPEFGIWQLLGTAQGRTTIVVLDSAVPGYQSPASETSNLDAVLCVRQKAADCANVLPPGWQTSVTTSPASTSVVALNPRLTKGGSPR